MVCAYSCQQSNNVFLEKTLESIFQKKSEDWKSWPVIDYRVAESVAGW